MLRIQSKIFAFLPKFPRKLLSSPLKSLNFRCFSALKPEVSGDFSENPENSSEISKKSPIIEQNFYNYEAITVKTDANDAENPFVYRTAKFGDLKLIACPIAAKHLSEIKGIHYLSDKVSTNYLKKLLKTDKKSLLVFEPDSHAKNLRDLFKSIEKLLKSAYFGSKRKPRNPFAKCASAKEIFNLNRRILIELKQNLNKICLILNYDGSVRLKGNIPSTNLIRKHLIHTYKDPENPYFKHDYLIPYNVYQGMLSAEALEKAGIPIKCLENKKIYPNYGVWAPTSQGYVELLAEFLEKNTKKTQNLANVLEIGCGTGVLSFLLLQKAGVKKVFAVDKSANAVRNARFNAEIMEVAHKFRCERGTVGEDPEKVEKLLGKLKFPKKFELIVANPPWIVASIINEKHELDNGVYDPDEKFLKSLFVFAKNHLSKSTNLAQTSLFLLIYSDISEKLGLQSPGRVRKLCEEHGLMILEERKKNFLEVSNSTPIKEDDIDPLYKFKTESKVYLYIMTHA